MRAFFLALFLAATPASAWPLPPRERASLEDAWTRDRLDTLLPALMHEAGVDMWILVAREYTDDPVLQTMLDARSFTARRTTILLIRDRGPGQPPERLTVSRYGLGGLFDPAWDPQTEPDQWARLAALVAERTPARIAINTSAGTALADGLTHALHQRLVASLPEPHRQRLVPAEGLAVRWLETRTAGELAAYPRIMATAHALIARGLSAEVIVPGITTTVDVQWWYRGEMERMGLATWFHPSVAVFRAGTPDELSGDTVIQPGDLVWMDLGIHHLGLATDTQQLAYVLKPGETAAPAGLVAGLAAANRLQDILTSEFQVGRSGNEVLARARARALSEGLDPSIYSHPVGFHGHGAGPSIGFWDNQSPDPRGARHIHADTVWAIELMNRHPIPEWGNQPVPFRLEETALFDGRTVRYLNGRQTRLHLIAAPANPN